eukprot:11763693-Alexandrium_andersonii.AAC.1
MSASLVGSEMCIRDSTRTHCTPTCHAATPCRREVMEWRKMRQRPALAGVGAPTLTEYRIPA